MWENANEEVEGGVSSGRVHLRSCITKKGEISSVCTPPPFITCSFHQVQAQWTTVVYTNGCSCHISVAVHAVVHVLSNPLTVFLTLQIYIIPTATLLMNPRIAGTV